MGDIEKLADEIEGAGVSRVFGITGSGQTLSLLDALIRRGISYHNCRFEGSAAIMAAAGGRLTNQAGVALSIKGPGLANMIPGLAAAFFESWPVVAIAEAYSPSTGPEKMHKRLDQSALVGSVVKGRRYMGSAGPDYGTMADWAAAENPGPVLIELAGSYSADQAAIPDLPTDPSAPDQLLRFIGGARRPIVIAGTLAYRRPWGQRLNKLSIPVFSTAAAKGVVDERLPHAAGVYTGVGLALVPESRLFDEADLIIGFGLRTNELLGLRQFNCPLVNVDSLGDVVRPGLHIDGQCGESDAGILLDALEECSSWGLDQLANQLHMLRNIMRGNGFQPPVAFEILQEHFDGAARLVLDTGYFCTVGEHAWRAPHANLCLGSGQGRYMGIALPTGIGAALHDGSIPTIVVTGDGGIGMFASELRTAVELKLPLLVVLMSDGGYGSIRTRAIKEGLVQSPMVMADPSWRAIIEAFGLPAWRVAGEEELRSALAQWCSAAGPGYIEITFDADGYQKMVEGIR